MDEVFDGRAIANLVGNGADLRNGQLARQHHLREAGIGQKARLGGVADVALGGGVQLDRRQIQLQDAHILHDQRIDTRVVQLPDQLARGVQLGVVQDGVERGEDARVVAVGKLHQLGDFRHAVTGVVPRAKARPADIDRVRTVQNRLAADVDVLGGGQQLNLVRQQTHEYFLRWVGARRGMIAESGTWG
ncbi:hypothetical protein D3C72_1807030 [compost metagenome]